MADDDLVDVSHTAAVQFGCGFVDDFVKLVFWQERN